jgi:SAM-dependent methyltransferase
MTTPPPRLPKPDVCLPNGSAELAMLDVYMPMMKSAAIISASRLGLFEALAGGPLAIVTLAAKIHASLEGTARLVDFLVSIAYLEEQDDCVANSASTQRWFTSAGQIDYTPGVLWTHAAWSMMGNLAEAVKAGMPEKTLWDNMLEQPELGPLFSSYMRAFSHDLGPDLLKHVPIAEGHQRLLDLGGSHGLHSIRFCQRYPQLEALIVDLPTALADTATTIEQEQLSDRVRLRPGDVLHWDWGGQHDVVFYLSVAHNQSADDNRQVIAKIGETLRPGGLLVIHEYLHDETPSAFQAAFRLTLLYETGTRTYHYDDYTKWLTAAGFTAIERIDLDPLEKGSLILARR